MEIGDATELVYLSLNANLLEGGVPISFKNLTKLQTLHLDDNGLSSGLSSIADCRLLTEVNIHNNQFKGSIPSAFENLTELTLLDLSQNGFTGSIPSAVFSKMHHLQSLILSTNSFTGL